MKILWIEDFGGGVDPSQIAKSIFDNFVGKIISEKWDQENSIQDDFSEFIRKNSLHVIDLIKNYPGFKEKEEDIFEYDFILIDINLSEGASFPKDNPDDYKDVENFHERAGFYIFNYLLQNGFPFDKIAFMTGEKDSSLKYEYTYEEFLNKTTTMLMPEIPSAFVKNDEGYEEIRTKLNELSSNPYLTLRRGVIKGCRSLKNKLQKEKNLENYILFNKTTDTELDKDYICDYLTKLEKFFSLNPPKNPKVVFTQFLKELSTEWEMSWGYFKSEKLVNLWSETGNIEFNFKNFCQNQMKMLRNWTSHNQLSDNLTEKELAFFFMIAMRSWFDLGIDEVFEYEKILGEIFSKPTDWKETDENFQVRLLRSYYTLRYKLEKDLKISPKGNEFYELMKTFGKASEIKKIDLKEEIRKNSKELFYQNFWHGLFPARLNLSSKILEDKPSVRMFINLNFKEISKKSFPYFIGKLIFNESF